MCLVSVRVVSGGGFTRDKKLLTGARPCLAVLAAANDIQLWQCVKGLSLNECSGTMKSRKRTFLLDICFAWQFEPLVCSVVPYSSTNKRLSVKVDSIR